MKLQSQVKYLLIAIALFAGLGCNTLTDLGASPTSTATPLPIYRDDFSVTGSGWTRTASDEVTNDYVNDQYFVSVTHLGMEAIVFGIANQIFSDAVLSVDIISSEGDLEENQVIVLWRIQDTSNYYALLLDNSSDFRIIKISDGHWYELVEPTHYEAAPEPGSNHVDIAFSKTESSIYINSKFVKSILDTSFTGGDIGLGVYTTADSSIEAVFDNVVVYDHSTWSPPLP